MAWLKASLQYPSIIEVTENQVAEALFSDDFKRFPLIIRGDTVFLQKTKNWKSVLRKTRQIQAGDRLRVAIKMVVGQKKALQVEAKLEKMILEVKPRNRDRFSINFFAQFLADLTE